MKNSKDDLARARPFIAKIPFNEFLGLEVVRVHPDGLTLRCRVRQELLNSQGALHGGVTASLADVAVGVAIQHRFRGTRSISTVELKVRVIFFRSPAESCLPARACFALTDTKGNLVGTAIVTYIFLDARGGSPRCGRKLEHFRILRRPRLQRTCGYQPRSRDAEKRT